MEDSIIIWKYLSRLYPDSHPVIYLSCCGNIRSNKTAIDRIISETKIIFCPPIEEQYLLTVVKAYLVFKKKQYTRNEIQVKPIY